MIAIASTAGLKGYPYVAAYCAAKHGVVGLTRALSLEMASTGITVNAICPGFIETPMLDRSVANIVEKTGMSENDIANSMVDDTDSPPRTSTTLSPSQTIDQAVATDEPVMDDSALAQNMLDQANTYEAEVKRLREEAYAMAPNLKPKRGRPKAKATADANT